MPQAVSCPLDGAAVSDATVCAGCGQRLADALGRVPFLVDELDVVLTKQVRAGDRAHSRSATVPLPYDPQASQAAQRLNDTLARWRTYLEGRHDRTAAADALWLASRVDQLRQLADAVAAFGELTRVVAAAERVVDLRPELWYAGPCGNCQADTYAQPGASYVRCRCGWQADAAERRTWLLQAAEDTLAHSSLAAQALSRLGRPVTGAMIRGYAFRGRLAAHGTDRLGRPLYRIGDLLDVLTEA